MTVTFDDGGSIEFTRDDHDVVRARFVNIPKDWREEALHEGRRVAEDAGFLAPSGRAQQRAGRRTEASSGTWLGRMAKATSLRVWMVSIFTAAIIGALVGKLWAPLTVPVFLAVFATLWLRIVWSPSVQVKCSWCGKRVKIGAAVCHHCGQPAAPARQSR